MKAEIFKGVFVFFLGVFIGGYGLKVSRPKGLPSEKDMLVMIKHLQESRDSLLQKVDAIGDTQIATYLDAKGTAKSGALAEAALDALLPVLNEELKIKFISNRERQAEGKALDGYEKVPVKKTGN